MISFNILRDNTVPHIIPLDVNGRPADFFKEVVIKVILKNNIENILPIYPESFLISVKTKDGVDRFYLLEREDSQIRVLVPGSTKRMTIVKLDTSSKAIFECLSIAKSITSPEATTDILYKIRDKFCDKYLLGQGATVQDFVDDMNEIQQDPDFCCPGFVLNDTIRMAFGRLLTRDQLKTIKNSSKQMNLGFWNYILREDFFGPESFHTKNKIYEARECETKPYSYEKLLCYDLPRKTVTTEDILSFSQKYGRPPYPFTYTKAIEDNEIQSFVPNSMEIFGRESVLFEPVKEDSGYHYIFCGRSQKSPRVFYWNERQEMEEIMFSDISSDCLEFCKKHTLGDFLEVISELPLTANSETERVIRGNVSPYAEIVFDIWHAVTKGKRKFVKEELTTLIKIVKELGGDEYDLGIQKIKEKRVLINNKIQKLVLADHKRECVDEPRRNYVVGINGQIPVGHFVLGGIDALKEKSVLKGFVASPQT